MHPPSEAWNRGERGFTYIWELFGLLKRVDVGDVLTKSVSSVRRRAEATRARCAASNTSPDRRCTAREAAARRDEGGSSEKDAREKRCDVQSAMWCRGYLMFAARGGQGRGTHQMAMRGAVRCGFWW